MKFIKAILRRPARPEHDARLRAGTTVADQPIAGIGIALGHP